MAISQPEAGAWGKCAAALLLVTGLAWSGPGSNDLTVTGPSDFVGAYIISGNGQSAVTGYGGAFQGVIATNIPSQTYATMFFCDDFSNDVSIPSEMVQVDITSLAAGLDFIDQTRFGAVTGWRPIQNSLPAGETLSQSTQNTINNADAFERYEMAAYLISNYSFFDSGPPVWDHYYSDPDNTGIQSAIWDILDPSSDLYLPPADAGQDGKVAIWLTNAADWLPAANQALLSRVRIVSDVAISQASSGRTTQVGIQEFLTLQAVPEPGLYGVLSLSLGLIYWAIRRERQRR
ncbi:MAG TPA: hypothetical protein VH640_09935 [Bryobacteraceae bacterium]|jgi:hypothetical protein